MFNSKVTKLSNTIFYFAKLSYIVNFSNIALEIAYDRLFLFALQFNYSINAAMFSLAMLTFSMLTYLSHGLVSPDILAGKSS